MAVQRRKRKTSASARKAKRRRPTAEPAHLPELHAHKSGIALHRRDSRDATRAARTYLSVRSINPATWELGNLRVLDGDLVIPYFFPIAVEPFGVQRDFYRTRKFRGKPKFLQPPDTAPKLYWGPLQTRNGCPTWEQVLSDPKHHCYVVEGEVKALALSQHGIPAIAIGGVDSWRSKSKPIDDWRHFPLDGRPITLCFDADLADRQQIQRALIQLAAFLKKQGAFVSVLLIPDLGDGVSGVDDFIAANSISGFRKLAKKQTKPFDHPDFAHWGLAARNDTDWGFGQLLLEHHHAGLRFLASRKRWLLWVDGD